MQRWPLTSLKKRIDGLMDAEVDVLTKSVLALGVVMGMCGMTHGTCNT